MNGEHPGSLMSIGEFSRYSGLSVRMLRHYAERGVLAPAEVDEFSGYRRYVAAQLRDAGRVRMLRDAGCGIPAIAELLPLFAAPDVLRPRLQLHLDELKAESQRVADQQALAATLLDGLAARSTRLDVTERTFPALRVLYLRRTVAGYPSEGPLWVDFRGPVAELTSRDPAAFGEVGGATYFDDEYRDADVEMAIWREYRGTSVPEGYEVVELPEQRVATVTHRGGFETINEATATAGSWVAQQGRTRVGPIFNVYVHGPGREPNPDNWVTEVNVPIAA
ncbi:GyrI-like domain-containing protein [Pseudoclavibacter sp. Z016]|uniref:MerR family transcriptional regulator n=1 Tax=Pseudoclavibacter sp. Z016 TaxID=2080581 RepID=UPI000CE77F12|nr:MerR family transcriptional regulator [Pseudoclavibacter sp. Z016]PPF78122.1 hypothetical protein C5B99_02115 [Pseudoclavibacter sp. Z016]